MRYPQGENSEIPATAAGDAARTEVEHDRLLVERVVSGDSAAEGELIERMRCLPRIVQHIHEGAWPQLPSDDALADIVQEAFGRVWSSLPSYRGDARLETWAYAFARNCYREATRRQVVRAADVSTTEFPLDQLPARNTGRPEAAPLDASARGSAGDPSEAGSRLDTLNRRLQGLDPDTRDLVLARAIERASFEELADRFGRSRAALKARYYRTLRELRRGLPAADRARRGPRVSPPRSFKGGAA